MRRGIEGVRIARLAGYFDAHLTPAGVAAVETACAALGVTRTADLGDAAAIGRAAAFLITAAEGGALHLPTLRTRRSDMEPLSRDRFVAGAILPAAWYLKAQRARAWYRERVRALFADADVLIAAASPCAATPIGAEWLDLGGTRVPLRPSMGLLAQPISCVGLPVVAAPVAAASALPIGVQIIAAPWREDLCFRVAAALAASGVAVAPLPPCTPEPHAGLRDQPSRCRRRSRASIRALRGCAGRQRRRRPRRIVLGQPACAALRRHGEPVRPCGHRRVPRSAPRRRACAARDVHRDHDLRHRLRHDEHRIRARGGARRGRQSQTWARHARRLAHRGRARQPLGEPAAP
jgi:hypothetical protein